MHCLRQGDLAALVGISPQGLWNILDGRSEPRPPTAQRLAAAFGITVSELVAGPGDCLRAAAAAFEGAPVRHAPGRADQGTEVGARRRSISPTASP
jgi:transcriptional regulator with XRE-family HTH domain